MVTTLYLDVWITTITNPPFYLTFYLSLCVFLSVSIPPLLPPAVGDPIILGPEQQFSKDVDDKANAYFQAIYNRGMNVDRLLDLLKQFKDSINKKERVSTPLLPKNLLFDY